MLLWLQREAKTQQGLIQKSAIVKCREKYFNRFSSKRNNKIIMLYEKK